MTALLAPGASVPSLQLVLPELYEDFGEEGFKLKLVTCDEEQYLIYKSSFGYKYYGDVRVFRVTDDGFQLLWSYHYDVEDNEGFKLEEVAGLEPEALNQFVDDRSEALFKAACEDPVVLITQTLL